MSYTLFNKRLKRKLVHPKVGLWFTSDLIEARAMLDSCVEYLKSSGLESLVSDFVITDAETGEEVNDNPIR